MEKRAVIDPEFTPSLTEEVTKEASKDCAVLDNDMTKEASDKVSNCLKGKAYERLSED